MRKTISRRDLIKGSAALGLTVLPPRAGRGAEPVSITPALVEAARKEAKVVLYPAMDLPVGEKPAGRSRRRIPASGPDRARRLGTPVPAHRPGIWQQHPRRRRGQQRRCRAFHSVEEERLADAVRLRRHGAQFPPGTRDPDGTFATTRIWLSSIAYNTNLVKPQDAPTSSRTCSIRNGPPRWSRAIRPTAAPS